MISDYFGRDWSDEMKLSTKGRYGLRAIVDIAVFAETEPAAVSAISERQDISIRYLEQLLSKLRKAGLVRSIRGAQGGYVLSRSAKEISVGDVLRALEGDLTPVDCTELTDTEETCSSSKYCVTKTVWKRINDSIAKTVDAIYLSELADEAKAVQQGKPAERKCER